MFDVEAGELLFEAGGCYEGLEMHSGKPLYNIGVIMHDAVPATGAFVQRTEDGEPSEEFVAMEREELAFFLVGEMLEWNDRRGYDWTLTYIKLTIEDIVASGETPEDRYAFIRTQLADQCSNLTRKKGGEAARAGFSARSITIRDETETEQGPRVFQFKQHCITLREDWEMVLTVQANNTFEQFGVLNQPQFGNSYN